MTQLKAEIDALAVQSVLQNDDNHYATFHTLIAPLLKTGKGCQAFLEVQFAHEDEEPEAFWQHLQEQPGFKDKKKIARLQRAVQLQSITGSAALSALLLSEDTKPEFTELSGFAGLTAADWEARIKKAGPAAIPDWVPADTLAKRRNRWRSWSAAALRPPFRRL